MNNPISDRIIDVFVNGHVSSLDGLYATDAIADCNVPQWRYQLRGAETITAAIREDELGVPHRTVTEWNHGVTDNGLFLEAEVRFNDGEDRMWRNLHLFRITDGRITEHRLYCSGIWSQSDIARYESPALAEETSAASHP